MIDLISLREEVKTTLSFHATKKPLTEQTVRGFIMNMAATYSAGWYTSTIVHEGLNLSVRYEISMNLIHKEYSAHY